MIGAPLLDICRRAAIPRADPQTFARVTSPTPALIFAGQLDQITPPRYAAQAARDLPNSTLIVVPLTGHSPVNGLGDCGYRIMASFLDDPSRRPDRGCLRRAIGG